MGRILVGTSGYSYRDWVGVLYPPDLPHRQWLTHYAQHFETVEINATFYRRFAKHVFAAWRRSVPDGFRFSIKGHRFITHVKRIQDVADGVARFFEDATQLADALACVLWQFPRSFVLEADGEHRRRLERFLALLPTHGHQVFEFRHPSWFVEDVFRLLDQAGAGFVINDAPALPSVERVTGRCGYIRLHGPGALYASSYSDEHLAVWAQKVRAASQDRDVYCYFNNDVSGFAVQNARRLKELLAQP